jgi:transposase
MTDLERGNALLKKELRDAKMERDILKKAFSIFSGSDGKSTSS